MSDTTLAMRSLPVDILALTTGEICFHLQASFDPVFYAERYPDIALGMVDPLEHYALFGWKEARDPCSWFCTQRYLAHYPDVARKGVNPLLH